MVKSKSTFSSLKSIEIKACIKSLQSLKKQKIDLISEIKDLANLYDSQAIPIEKASSFLESLPILTLRDSLAKEYGYSIHSSLRTMKNRSELRKKRLKKQEELLQMNQQIYLAEIDVLLVKMNTLLKTFN